MHAAQPSLRLLNQTRGAAEKHGIGTNQPPRLSDVADRSGQAEITQQCHQLVGNYGVHDDV